MFSFSSVLLSAVLPVIGVFGAGLVYLDNDEHMLKVRTDGFGGER